LDRKVSVKVVTKKSRGIESYTVTLPKDFARELDIKGGDILFVVIAEVEVDGIKRKGIFYYKP